MLVQGVVDEHLHSVYINIKSSSGEFGLGIRKIEI
jgi:hypothetical protein